MALSFCYAPAVSSQYRPYNFDKDEIENTCQAIKTTCQITYNEPNITLTGDDFMLARRELLQTCPLGVQLAVTVPYTLSSKQLESLERETDTLIRLNDKKEHHHSCFINDTLQQLLIIGRPEQVEHCRVRLLVLIDEMKSFTVETVELPIEIQYLICGRKRAGLLPIIEETSTNIYFPSPFDTPTTITTTTTTNTTTNTNITTINNKKSVIYITGEHVTRVKDMFNKLFIQKQKSMYHKDTALYARKIDWLLLHRRDELRKIMHDNGSFILFPKLGSGDNKVTVYAENRVNAERTLRALNFQASMIYEACFYFNPNDVVSSALVTQLSHISGSEVIYNNDCIEVLGTERAIRNVYQRLQEMQFLQVFHKYTLFRVESANEQRDFISGKKNGKINKIMKTSGAKIRFLSFINDYNFVIEVESTSFTKALDGLTLLQEELPAEISFYVPESYHKRIIGVGGKNIQRIMKKYGVYVKFSNTEEFAALGGYYNNQDNVVARTPMKNQINLDNLRHAVMELVHVKDRNYIVQSIHIPYALHRELISHFQGFISEEITKKTNTVVHWPDAELASDTVELMGPEAHIPIAIEMLQTIVPEDYIVHVPRSQVLDDLLVSESFKKDVVVPIQELGIQLSFSTKKKKENEKGQEEEEHGDDEKKDEIKEKERETLAADKNKKGDDSQNTDNKEHVGDDELFLFSMTRDKVTKGLPRALSILIDHLQQLNVPLYSETLAKTVNITTPTTVSDKIQSPTRVTSVLDQLRSVHDHPIYNTKRPPSYSFFAPNEPPRMDWQLPRDDDNLRAIFDAAPISSQDRSRYRMSMPPLSTAGGGTPPNFTGFGSGSASQSATAPTGNSTGGSDIWGNGLSKRRSMGFPSSSTSNDHPMIFDQPGFYPVMGIARKEFNPYSDLKPSLSDPTSTENFQSRLSSSEGFQSSVLYQPPATFTPTANPAPTQFFAKSEQVNVQDMLDTLSSGSTGFDPRRPPNDQENKGSRPPPGIDI
ncbi:hypothetical protein K501DRAFT_334771 [Backusella circina FSU 941]|nr:hypothetical protein K501DRAFT_334771 [Backusella circina FSU 941]